MTFDEINISLRDKPFSNVSFYDNCIDIFFNDGSRICFVAQADNEGTISQIYAENKEIGEVARINGLVSP